MCLVLAYGGTLGDLQMRELVRTGDFNYLTIAGALQHVMCKARAKRRLSRSPKKRARLLEDE